ncbi:MAG: hypothetical protein AAF447_06495 [Myxococcota bacterium]
MRNTRLQIICVMGIACSSPAEVLDMMVLPDAQPPDTGPTDLGCADGATREEPCAGGCGVLVESCVEGDWVAGDCDDSGCGPEPCEPGTVDTEECGRCGTRERFCTADEVFTPFGDCTGEGICLPGTMEEFPCGNCGVEQARCTSECAWETTTVCTGEGVCTPGSLGDETDATCTEENFSQRPLCTEECDFEPGFCEYAGTDIMFLFHSYIRSGFFSAEVPPAMRAAVTELQRRVPNARFGISTYATLLDGFTPFGGEVAFTDDVPAFMRGYEAFPDVIANPRILSWNQALGTLAGLPPHPNSRPFVCRADELDGACWRPFARKILFFHPVFENSTNDASGLYDATGPIEGAVPHEWDDVAAAIRRLGIELKIWDGCPPAGCEPFITMFRDIGQDYIANRERTGDRDFDRIFSLVND